MEKTTKYAEIPQVRSIVFSDPSYDSNVWCQHRTQLHTPERGWVMKLESRRDKDDYLMFALSLGRRTTMSGLSFNERPDGTAGIGYYAHHAIEEKEIGMDTACCMVGTLENLEAFGEEAAIHTASDGFLGDLFIATCKGEQDPSGFLFVGQIDGAIVSEESLFDTITAAFDGQEISQERFESLTDRDALELRMQLVKEIQKAKELEHGDETPMKGKGRYHSPER